MKYILLIPALILFCLFVVWPMVELVKMSFTKTDFITTTFVGIDNYLAMLENPAFITAGVSSIIYTILLIIGQVGGAVVIALIVCKLEKKWIDFSRIAFYLPVLSAGLIIAQSWKWIFNINGPANYLLGLFGIEKVSWFSQGITGIPAISLIVTMSGIGAYLLILLSAITTIDKEILGAAQVDGASSLQIKVRIIFPMIIPTIGICILMTIISAFQVFETVMMMAPYEYTATMAYAIFTEAFVMSNHGGASAMAIVLTIIILIAGIIKNRLSHE
jgi:ABC-type sugar transport system permease subunit